MNILQVQDDLKNFSQQQLIQEMKQPKGVAPQFLVLGEITRRKRMSDDMKTRGAADQKTVAQEVVSCRWCASRWSGSDVSSYGPEKFN